jgi:Phospholipase_D-nuclease N-terminal
MYAEDVMARSSSDLSDRSRRLIIAAAITEAILKTAVVIDIRRRPASQIRGSKRIWIVAAVLVNSAGVGPLSYFAFGRRRHAAAVEPTAPARAE